MLKEWDGLHDIGTLDDDWEKVVITRAEEQVRDLGADLVDGETMVAEDYLSKLLKLMEHLTVVHDKGWLKKLKTAEHCRPDRTML